MSLDPPSSDNGQVADTLADALPGLFRVAAGVWIRTGVWAFETSLRVGARLARASTSPEAAAELVEEVRSGVRSYARELLGVTDLDERVRQLMPPRRNDARPATAAGELRSQGAELLRMSADVEAEDGAHPAYARILTELAPDEARIVRLLMRDGPQPTVDVYAANLIGMGTQLVARDLTMIGTEAGCRHVEKVPAYLNNLRRLGLVAITHQAVQEPMRYQVLEAQPDAVAAIRDAGRVKTVHKRIEMTPFGIDFANTALPLTPVDAT
jgi:hypothetical protein